MPDSRIDSFLAGERPDDVAIYLPDETVDSPESLLETGVAEPAPGGVYVVVEGDRGRSMFESVTGIEVMPFASSAMGTPGRIDRDLAGGACPNAIEGPHEHDVQFVFAFAEEQNEAVGDIYAEGDVIHAYALCRCGERYGEKWVVDVEDGSSR